LCFRGFSNHDVSNPIADLEYLHSIGITIRSLPEVQSDENYSIVIKKRCLNLSPFAGDSGYLCCGPGWSTVKKFLDYNNGLLRLGMWSL
jgi:hypothetical protein